MNDNLKIKESELLEILGSNTTPAGYNKTQYKSTCPYCGKEKHFYISRKTQLWDCKKCGEEGNIYKLLLKLDKLFLLGDFKSIDRNKLKLLSDYDKEDTEDIDLEPEERNLPKFFKRVYKDEYLKSRGFKDKIFNKYIIGHSRKMKNYTIISIQENNKCRGYLARLNWSKEKIKRCKAKGLYVPMRWFNDKGAKFSNLLFGLDEINKNTTTVILLEGVTDKFDLDDILELDEQDEVKCCCTFGKKISKTQILKLLKKGVENVILVFDEDAIKQMKRYGKELSNFFNVKITFTYNKDINESSREEVLDIFNRLNDIHKFDRKFVKLL